MKRTFQYYLRVWLRLTFSSCQVAFMTPLSAFLFILAKFIRFGFFLLLIFLVVTKTQTFVGYSFVQTMIFYIVFNIVDSLTQLLFRDVYRFRQKIITGDFDLILSKPISPLFRVLFGGADPLDLITLLPYSILLIYFLLQVQTSFIFILFFFLLIVNACIIAASFHIIVLALGVVTTEIDHAVMIYRDVTSMGRFSIDIYKHPIRNIITFIIPVGVMMTFPVKALFGLLSLQYLLISFGIGASFFILSIYFWRFALKKYSSASS